MADDEHKEMVRRVHDWLFEPPIEGQTTRAEQLDRVMAGIRAGRIGARVLLWIAGFVAAIGAAWAQIKGAVKGGDVSG